MWEWHIGLSAFSISNFVALFLNVACWIVALVFRPSLFLNLIWGGGGVSIFQKLLKLKKNLNYLLGDGKAYLGVFPKCFADLLMAQSVYLKALSHYIGQKATSEHEVVLSSLIQNLL